MQRMAGQSTVEFLVSAAVIVPLLLLIPTLANILLVQTEAHKAARHVAWERVAYSQDQLKDSGMFASEVEDRFLRFSTAGFGNSLGVADRTPWRDFGQHQSATNPRTIVDYDSGVHVGVNPNRSSTDGHTNASAHLAGKGGSNAIQLDTLQSGQLTIGLRSDSSLLSSPLATPAADPVSGEPRFFVRSSSALVVDSWMPANDTVFHDRVADIGGGVRNVGSLHAPITNALRPIFQELDDHMYVNTTGTDTPFDMVDPEQSTRLPAYLKQPD